MAIGCLLTTTIDVLQTRYLQIRTLPRHHKGCILTRFNHLLMTDVIHARLIVFLSQNVRERCTSARKNLGYWTMLFLYYCTWVIWLSFEARNVELCNSVSCKTLHHREVMFTSFILSYTYIKQSKLLNIILVLPSFLSRIIELNIGALEINLISFGSIALPTRKFSQGIFPRTKQGRVLQSVPVLPVKGEVLAIDHMELTFNRLL